MQFDILLIRTEFYAANVGTIGVPLHMFYLKTKIIGSDICGV